MSAEREQTVVKSAPSVQMEVMTENGRRPYATKYTEEIHQKLIESIVKGRSLRDSGLLAGLGRDTFESWLHYGRNEPDRYPHFAILAADVERARAERRAEAVDNIVTVGNTQQANTWQANAWYLERTDPENWGRKDKVEHVGNDQPKTQINTVVLIDADAREAARDVLRRVASHAGSDIPIGPSGRVQLEDGST